MFQCYLEMPESLRHFTSLEDTDCRIALAYTLVRLAFLNVEALSDPNAAIRLYKLAIEVDPVPSSVSYEGLGNAIQASGGNGVDLRHLTEAVSAYRKAIMGNRKASTLLYMAVALERLGETEESERILESLQRSEAPVSCFVDSWGYVRWHMRKSVPSLLNLHRGTRDMIKIAIDAAMPLIDNQRQNRAHGLCLEFGVGSGKSLRMTQEMLPLDIELHGFDTFTGLPTAWGEEPAGSYSTGGVIPAMDGKVYFHKGLFCDTILPFFDDYLGNDANDAYVAYANIDCDLYTSTVDILESLHGKIVPGTIIVFDEYIMHPTWRQDEFRAWRESCKRFGWSYEYLGFSLSTKQAIVRVIAV